MATATADSTGATGPTSPATAAAATATTEEAPLQLDSIPVVDLNFLSQSELYALSLCSSSTFDPRRCDDVVVPKIDRSVFNESAGSRKQTFSRLRLAPASASPSSIRLRTPHLRSTSHNFHPQYLDSDPEKAESRQIVALLKELFGMDNHVGVSNDDPVELVPIRVDYSNSVPQLTNVVATGQKRRRGRPRKNENAIVLVENKVENHSGNEVPAAVNAMVVHESAEDKDKEIVNRDGIVVDLVQLGMIEDPFGEELRRRTAGMGSEDELLGFLKGLDGQWGSRRKKKRIVDASEFGNALPKGWRLMISCKKKEGHVWLFCRRYISPNGRQFVSCKEVSAYLLSLRGIEVGNQQICAQILTSVDAADKIAYPNTADLVPDEKREGNSPCPILSPVLASTSVNSEVTVTVETGDFPPVPVRDFLRCEKCNLGFDGQEEFLQHQLSSHRRKRARNGESVTDGVIIKDGKFECQFCHKIFDERHRYNGHIGAHIRYQVKSSEKARASGVGMSAVTVPLDYMTNGDPKLQHLNHPESNVATGIVIENADDMPVSSEPPGIVHHQCGNFKELNDKLVIVDDVTDIGAPKSISHLDSGVVLSVNECRTHCGNSSELNAKQIDAYETEKSHTGQSSYKSCSPLPVDKQQGYNDNNFVVPQEREVSGSVLDISNKSLVSCDAEFDDSNFSLAKKVLGLEERYNVDNESINRYCDRKDGPDNSAAISVKQHLEFGVQTHRESHIVNDKLFAAPKASIQNTGSESRTLNTSGNKEENSSKDVCNVFPSSVGCVDKLNKMDVHGCEDGHGFSESDAAEKCKDEASAGFLESHEQVKSSGSSFPSFLGLEVSCGFEEYVNKVSAREKVVTDVNIVQNTRKSELDFPFDCNTTGVSMDCIVDDKHEGGFELRPSFPFENGKIFIPEDNMNNLHSHGIEESEKDPSGHVLLAQSCIPGTSSEAYNPNKVFSVEVNGGKFCVGENTRNQELCLAFDDRADSLGEQYGAKSSNIHSGSGQTYDVQSNLNSIAPNAEGNSKEGRDFGIDLRDSCFSNKTFDFENDFNTDYPARTWEVPKVLGNENSGTKFLVGFDSSNPQPVEDVMAGNIWRTEENLLQGDLTNTSTPLLHSPNNFHTFDIVSNKGNEGIFGVNSYGGNNGGFEGLTLGRTEPTEYSFMTTESSNSFPGESKGLSSNNDPEGFDSSFWLGKDSLTPNLSSQDQVPTVCVWCRNAFYQEPVSSGAQADAIGTMCPACSSRISHHFNVL